MACCVPRFNLINRNHNRLLFILLEDILNLQGLLTKTDVSAYASAVVSDYNKNDPPFIISFKNVCFTSSQFSFYFMRPAEQIGHTD